MEEWEREKIALINALVEERAYNLRLKASLPGGIILQGPVIDIAKVQLREEFKAYPEVQF